MGEPREPPDYEDAIQAFRSWVVGIQSFEVIDPDTNLLRPFVVADAMRRHFEEDNHRKLNKLISVHFPDAGSLWQDDIVPNNVAVFGTLLSISKGWWMKHFCHHGDLSDTALPFDATRPPPNWPAQGADFLPRFCEAQWKFCAPVLRAPFVGKRFPKDMVLPIVFKQTLNTEGSSASLWRIKIHSSYNNLISETDKEKLGPLANTFVMKTYFTSEAERYYNTEVAAFRHLGPNPSIIKFHGSFARGDSYNVLLEYADKGTLADYFRDESPPSEGEEIIQFWEAMFKLIDALRRIHEVGSDNHDGPRIFQGRHQDVKPENVLIVSNGSENRGDWIFKLADLGISNFKGRKPGRQDSADKNARGTRTYGAPESYRPDGTYVHDTLREGQNSDVWSLGCIYSEAARWLKDGHRGIQAYRQERQGETSQIQGFRDGDCFHDGEKMLTCVRQCHKTSARNLRSEDFITGPVIEVLIGDMLGMAEARSTAYRLYERSKQLVRDAKSDLQAARTESEPSSLPKFSGRPRNRSFTVPSHDFRPPPPPNPPPGFFPAIGLHTSQNPEAFASPYFSSNPNSPPRILDPSDTTSEPEGLENLRLSSTSPEKSFKSGELSDQRPMSPQAVRHDEPEDIDPFSSMTNGKQPDSSITWAQYCHDTAKARSPTHEATIHGHASSNSQHSPPVAPEARYESPSPPRSQPAVPTSPSPYYPPPSAIVEPTTPQKSPSTRHAPTEIVPRLDPLIIQATPKLPELSLEDALEWRRKRKGKGPKKRLKDWQYLDRLKERDHVFLIDDSDSMRKHWVNVQKVFEAVSYIVKEEDPDGFDLWFTGPGKPLKKCQKTTPALQAVESRLQQGTTDITTKLNSIFDDYIEALKKPRTGFLGKLSKPVKPLSLYVFTDGVWEKDCNPSHLVETFVRQLETLGKIKGKVGLQFVSFGNDPVGMERMELLDSGLNVKLDIVDTEPWHGNVWKMLLGAINDSFDKIHDKHHSRENSASSSSNRMSMIASHKEEYT